jgi:hypothetical protein
MVNYLASTLEWSQMWRQKSLFRPLEGLVPNLRPLPVSALLQCDLLDIGCQSGIYPHQSTRPCFERKGYYWSVPILQHIAEQDYDHSISQSLFPRHVLHKPSLKQNIFANSMPFCIMILQCHVHATLNGLPAVWSRKHSPVSGSMTNVFSVTCSKKDGQNKI